MYREFLKEIIFFLSTISRLLVHKLVGVPYPYFLFVSATEDGIDNQDLAASIFHN